MREKRDRYEKMLGQVYAEGVKSGAFREVDLSLVSLATFGMCNWAYQWYDASGSMGTREIAYQFWSFLVGGVGTPEIAGATLRPVTGEFR